MSTYIEFNLYIHDVNPIRFILNPNGFITILCSGNSYSRGIKNVGLFSIQTPKKNYYKILEYSRNIPVDQSPEQRKPPAGSLYVYDNSKCVYNSRVYSKSSIHELEIIAFFEELIWKTQTDFADYAFSLTVAIEKRINKKQFRANLSINNVSKNEFTCLNFNSINNYTVHFVCKELYDTFTFSPDDECLVLVEDTITIKQGQTYSIPIDIDASVLPACRYEVLGHVSIYPCISSSLPQNFGIDTLTCEAFFNSLLEID